MGNAINGTSGNVDVLIIGGGPTGIGAAYRLDQYNHKSWLVVDAEKNAGGMAGSIKTKQGFRFDHGYKTFYSRYEYIDELLEQSYENSSKTLIHKTPKSFVRLCGNLISFPFQNNLSGLPINLQESCAVDLIKVRLKKKNQQDQATGQNRNLDTYLKEEWGEHLSNVFFRPYLFKSFAIPTAKLSSLWASAKIPPSDVGADINAMLNNTQRDPEWGVEDHTVYPDKGGLVGMWRTICRKLNKENLRFKCEIVELNIDEKYVRTKDDVILRYETLLSTMPLPLLLNLADRSELAMELANTSAYIVCLGIRGQNTIPDATGCIYYPESDCIFHRVCVFSNYDPDSVPEENVMLPTLRCADAKLEVTGKSEAGPYWSLVVEISGGPLKTIDEATIVDDAVRDCCAVGLIVPSDEIVAVHFTEMTHGYPLPTTGSEDKINTALQWLREKDIYSRGKFGGFKYHIGDLDHCIVQGVEAVDNIVTGQPETLIWSKGCDVYGDVREKIKTPCFNIDPLHARNSSLPDDVINAADVRGAITKEPLTSSGSTTVASSISNLSPPSTDISDSDS